MRYAIHPDQSPEVFVWRYATLEEAKQEARRICLENNTQVDVFEKVCSFKPVASQQNAQPMADPSTDLDR